MCEANDETITDIVSEFPKLLHKEYKRKHEWMRKTVFWGICRKKSFNFPEKWYKYKPLPCTEN